MRAGRTDLQDEYRGMLRQYGIDFDERFCLGLTTALGET